MKRYLSGLLFIFLILLLGCGANPEADTSHDSPDVPTNTPTPAPSPTFTATPLPPCVPEFTESEFIPVINKAPQKGEWVGNLSPKEFTVSWLLTDHANCDVEYVESLHLSVTIKSFFDLENEPVSDYVGIEDASGDSDKQLVYNKETKSYKVSLKVKLSPKIYKFVTCS